MKLRTLLLLVAVPAVACSPRDPVLGTYEGDHIAVREAVGLYVADDVTFQSALAPVRFEVRATAAGDRLRVEVPAELGLAGGRVYLLRPVPPEAFEYEDEHSRAVRLELRDRGRARLVLLGPGRGGVVTFQLVRRRR